MVSSITPYRKSRLLLPNLVIPCPLPGKVSKQLRTAPLQLVYNNNVLLTDVENLSGIHRRHIAPDPPLRARAQSPAASTYIHFLHV